MPLIMAWCWCYWESTPFCFAWLLERLFIPASVAALVYFLGIRQLKRKRAIDFAEKQLTEFYGPMVAARVQIENFSGFDSILRAAAHYAHARALEGEEGRNLTMERAERFQQESKEAEAFYGALDEQFLTKGIDALIAMRSLFAAKIVYADDDTQPWYDYFHSFVEMWKTHRENKTNKFMPRTVSATVGAMFDEELLQPFYLHLRERAAFYHGEIAGKRRAKVPAPAPPTTSPEELLKSVDSHPLIGRKRRRSSSGE